MDRCYGLENIFSKQKAVNKKQRKAVRWNGMEFESISKLARHLGLSQPSNIGNHIRTKKLVKGHYAELITKENSMTIESLKGLKSISGFDIYQDDKIADGKWSDVNEKYSVCVHHGDNTISFRIKKENGVSGCQVSTMIELAEYIIKHS